MREEQLYNAHVVKEIWQNKTGMHKMHKKKPIRSHDALQSCGLEIETEIELNRKRLFIGQVQWLYTYNLNLHKTFKLKQNEKIPSGQSLASPDLTGRFIYPQIYLQNNI